MADVSPLKLRDFEHSGTLDHVTTVVQCDQLLDELRDVWRAITDARHRALTVRNAGAVQALKEALR